VRKNLFLCANIAAIDLSSKTLVQEYLKEWYNTLYCARDNHEHIYSFCLAKTTRAFSKFGD